jgi:hypothetical protein
LIGRVKMDAATNYFHFYYDVSRATGKCYQCASTI